MRTSHGCQDTENLIGFLHFSLQTRPKPQKFDIQLIFPPFVNLFFYCHGENELSR